MLSVCERRVERRFVSYLYGYGTPDIIESLVKSFPLSIISLNKHNLNFTLLLRQPSIGQHADAHEGEGDRHGDARYDVVAVAQRPCGQR